MGSWVARQRSIKDTLSQEKKDRLNDLGFDWDPLETDWQEGFSHLKKYYESNGHSRVPAGHKTREGFPLGSWVGTQRNKKDTLSQEKKDRLNDLGFDWDPFETDWQEGFSHLKKYYKTNGHSKVPARHKTKEGYPLGNWVARQRSIKDSLIQERKARLDSLGFVWKSR